MRLISLLVITVFILSSCADGKNADLHRFIKKTAERPGRPIKPIPDYKPMPSYRYSMRQKRRDPFAKIRKKAGSKVSAPNMNRRKQPLELFSLDSLKFVGLLKHGSKHWALILAPTGEVYRTMAGQYMGRNYGRIKAISAQQLILVETVRLGGRWKKKTVKLKLR